MIYIDKSNMQIQQLLSEIKAEYNNYDLLNSDSKNKIKVALISEQKGLCAYCMMRIKESNSTIEHYIPRNGEFGDNSLSLNYRNLFAVCNESRNAQHCNKHCDASKADMQLTINPCDKSHIEKICYRDDGEIYSEDSIFNNDLNNILKLNLPRLKNNRRTAYETYIKELTKHKNGNWTKEYVQKALDNCLSSDPQKPYVGIIIYKLNKRLRRI